MSGMCATCLNDVALPNLDVCRACEDEARAARKRMFQLIEAQVCQFGHPLCTNEHQCGDCAEFAAYPRDAA